MSDTKPVAPKNESEKVKKSMMQKMTDSKGKKIGLAVGVASAVGLGSLLGGYFWGKNSGEDDASEAVASDTCKGAFYRDHCSDVSETKVCKDMKAKADKCTADSKDDFCKAYNDATKKPLNCKVKLY